MKRKKKLIVNSVLVSALALSVLSPTAFAHDALEHEGINKGESEKFVFSAADLENLAKPKMTGGKTLGSFTKQRGVQIEPKNGRQNNAADVYAHKGFAYLGTHTANGANGGVRIFDLKDPSNPVEVAQFAHEIPHTWQEKVIVKTVNTPDFKGDLAVVSLQQTSRNNANRPDSFGGVLLYDVTDPYNPVRLGFHKLEDRRITGTHELYLTTQGNRALLLTSNPYADYYTGGASRDFEILDVSNPAEPELLWGFDPRDLPEVPQSFNGYHWFAPDGKTRPSFNHSVITDNNGHYAYVSYWDLGTIIFDIRDPENPVYLGRTDYRADQKVPLTQALLQEEEMFSLKHVK